MIYQIRCGRSDGTLACLILIARASDAAAVALAHSLDAPNYEKVEVWRDEHCVHEAFLTQSGEVRNSAAGRVPKANPRQILA